MPAAENADARLEQEIRHYQQAIRRDPDDARACHRLGLLYLGRDCLEPAAACFRRALRIRPGHLNALNCLGMTLMRQGQLSQALAYFERALEISPVSAGIWHNFGSACKAQGKLDQALAAYRRGIELASVQPLMDGLMLIMNAHSLLLTLHYHPALTAGEIFAEHRAWGARMLQKYSPLSAHPNLPDPERRLRVGYVSAVFRHHAAAFFVEPVLLAHDPTQVEVYCYSGLSSRPDAVTRRLQARADHWREIQSLDTPAAAALIQQDQIDILVDLDGHTAHNRLEVFALKPAPVQVSYVGYPNTTGLGTMDYR
ncbi:MAG: tetratricopeptide repeat protein, partial [Candidatus Sericytochromatia bacterium]